MSARLILTVKDGTMAGKKYVFVDRAACVIGRAQDCDLSLPNTIEFFTVSRYHCLVQIKPNGVWVRDLGSRNGTCVNSMRLTRFASRQNCVSASDAPLAEHELKDGDELSVVGTVFRVGIDTVNDSPKLASSVPQENFRVAVAEPCLN